MNRNNKKILTIILALMMLFTTLSPVFPGAEGGYAVSQDDLEGDIFPYIPYETNSEAEQKSLEDDASDFDAFYVPIEPLNMRTITFNFNGNGQANTTRGVTLGMTWAQFRNTGTDPRPPANPTRTNHIFAGWFNTSAASGGTNLTAMSGSISANHTFWARWTPVRTITFNPNGGTPATATRSIPNGTTWNTFRAMPTSTGIPNDPTRSGYSFLGWFNTSAASGGTSIWAMSGTAGITSNHTFWARWSPTSRTITFNGNGGTPATTTRTIPHNTAWSTFQSMPTSTGIPNNPSRAGHSFVGWYNTPALTGGMRVTNMSGNITINHTFSARWQLNVPTITNPSTNGQQIQSQNLTVRWDSLPGATYDFSMRNLTTDEVPLRNVVVSGTSFVVSQALLIPGHEYRIAVRAQAGGLERWSERTFRVEPLFWHSDGNWVGFWPNSVTTGPAQLRGTTPSNFNLSSRIAESRHGWAVALDIPIGTATHANANIQTYGGSLEAMREASGIGGSWDGLTIYSDRTLVQTAITTDGRSVSIYRFSGQARTFVTYSRLIRNFTTDEVRFITVHEHGHALGFRGHAPNTSDAMFASLQPTSNGNISANEARHLRQIYHMFR